MPAIAGLTLMSNCSAASRREPPASTKPMTRLLNHQLESVGVGWSKVSDDFQPPELGPGPVTYDRDRPYVLSNNEASGFHDEGIAGKRRSHLRTTGLNAR